MKKTFYKCARCGNVVVKVEDKGTPISCCGAVMDKIEANTVDASAEKHVPAVSYNDGIVEVNVGSVDHPMEEEHYISFIYLATTCGGQRKVLKAGDAPFARFSLIDDEPVAVYEYCTLHGLWVYEF